MGWSVFSDIKTRSDMVDHVRRSYQCGGQVVLRSTAIGNNFWALLELPGAKVVVAHSIIQGSRPNSPGWGCKGLSHFDGIDCPVDYLRLLSPTEDARELEWRADVRKYHDGKVALRKQKAHLTPGKELTLYGKQYRLVESLRARGWNVLCLDDDKVYRMSVKQLNQALLDLKQKDELEQQQAQQAQQQEEPQQALLL
jgi:hypothetical protein